MSWEKHDAERIYKTPVIGTETVRQFAHITDIQWAYLAGIVDGEGCIHIRRTQQDGKRRLGTYYCLTIAIGNTSAALMKWLVGTFQGSYTVRRGSTSTRKTVWGWLVAAQVAQEICENILPYLTVKKDQAELALMFRSTYVGQRSRAKKVIDPYVLELRQLCYEEMRKLKQTAQDHTPVRAYRSAK